MMFKQVGEKVTVYKYVTNRRSQFYVNVISNGF